MSPARDAGYMRIYAIAYFAKTRISHIFFTYNGIFKRAYAKIMLHMLYMQKFVYIPIYATYFHICDRIFQHFPCPMLF